MVESSILRQVGWEEILLRLLFVSYTFFLAGFFYIPNAVDLYKFYSVAVLLPGLLLLPRGLKLLQGNILFMLVISYLVYMMISPAWGDYFDWRAYFDYLRLALYMVVFVMATVLLFQRWPRQFSTVLRTLSLLAALAALISLFLWSKNSIPGPRLVGIGILKNPNASGYVYGVMAVMNLAYVLEWRGQTWLRALHIMAVLSLFGFVVLTYSRGALLALAAACLVLFIGKRTRSVLFFAVTLGVIIIFTYFYFPQVTTLLDRGEGVRPDIWQALIFRIAEAPVWGHGYLSEQYVPIIIENSTISLFAHNAYLATLRDGGVVGGLLLFTMLGTMGYQAWRLGRIRGDYRYLALFAFAMVCMMFDTDRLLTRPRELWLVLWLPMALVLCDLVQKDREPLKRLV